MVKQSNRLSASTLLWRVSLASALIVGTVNSPSIAQPQQHHTNTSNSRGKPPTPHYTSMSQSQMANMLDDVSAGKSPNLPAHSSQTRTQTQPIGRSGMRPTMSNIVRPRAGEMLRGSGQSMGYSHKMGMSQSNGMSRGAGMSHGMNMARGMGMGAMGAGMMGTMGSGSGMGMPHSGMTGGGAAQFMQQFKQKFGALMPAEGAGSAEGGEGGESGGMPAVPGGMPGGGGGMQAQLMQRLFQGQAPGGGAPGAAMGGMGGMPGAMGGMPISRPSARGMGINMPSMSRAQPQNSQSDAIKRPPGVSGITGGAPISTPVRGASSASDLERQMEQQYGR